ncbi:MAG: hypothetical protein PVG69_14300 [Desulfobacterales bacterium]|jgi:hypothetical protein
MPSPLFFNNAALSKINQNFRFISTVRAGGLSRSLFASGFLGVRGMFSGGFFIGFQGTGDNHFSLIAAILTGADLLECFLGGIHVCHIHRPPYAPEPFSKINDDKSTLSCQTLTLADFG